MRKHQLWIENLLALAKDGYLLASDAPGDVYANMSTGTGRFLEKRGLALLTGTDEHGRHIYQITEESDERPITAE